jgi:hypothetical protein
LLKELSAPEDHLSGVLTQLPGGVQGGLGLFYGPIGVSGVEAEEGAEGAVFPLELFPILPFQEALVGEPRGAGEAAHQVQDGLFVFLLEKDQAGVDAEVELRGCALGHPGFILPPFASFAALREVLRFWMNRERKRKSVRICGLFFSCLHLHATPFAHPVWVRSGW